MFVVMYKTLVSHENVMKNVECEGIKLCENFEGTKKNKSVQQKLQGWGGGGGVPWGREDVLGPGYFSSDSVETFEGGKSLISYTPLLDGR